MGNDVITVSPLNRKALLYWGLSRLNTYELRKEYVNSIKFVNHIVNFFLLLELRKEFEKIISARKQWICTFEELEELMHLQSMSAHEASLYAKQINPNVRFQLSERKHFDFSCLNPTEAEIIMDLSKDAERRILQKKTGKGSAY